MIKAYILCCCGRNILFPKKENTIFIFIKRVNKFGMDSQVNGFKTPYRPKYCFLFVLFTLCYKDSEIREKELFSTNSQFLVHSPDLPYLIDSVQYLLSVTLTIEPVIYQ